MLRGKASSRPGLVDDIDRLVRQEPVGDVALGQFCRSIQRGVRDRDPVVVLILLPQPHQDLDRLRHRRRLNQHGLEAALQRAILLDILAILVQGRGPDALQFAACQRGLEHVGRIDRALGGSSPHQRVQLVDEEDHILALDDLVHHGLEPFLELAAILGPGNHGGHIE